MTCNSDFSKAGLMALLANLPKERSDNTIRTYAGLIATFALKLGDNAACIYDDHEDAVRYIEENYTNLNTRSTLLAAVSALTGGKVYETKQRQLMESIREQSKSQLTLPHRLSTRLTQQQIRSIYHNYRCQVRKGNADCKLLQNAILSAVCGGVFPNCPPRRLEYRLMKVKNFDRQHDNFYEHGVFYFNIYKRSNRKTHDQRLQKTEVPTEIDDLIVQLLKSRNADNDYLFLSKVLQPYSTWSFHRKLVDLFGCGCDQLRSSFVTSLYENTPPLLTLEKTAKQMGHSVFAQMNSYVKVD